MKAQNENLENVADVEAVPVYLFREVLKALVNNAGFYIPKVTYTRKLPGKLSGCGMNPSHLLSQVMQA